MSDCRRTVARLTSYADDALPADERAEVEQHLAKCPPCRTAAMEETGARQIVRSRATHLAAEPAPDALRQRCEALARDYSGSSSRGLFGWLGRRSPGSGARLVPASLTAALVVFVIAALASLATQRSSTLLAAQLTADHSKCFRLFAPDEAAAAGDVEQMLSDRFGWDVHVPPSSPEHGIELMGARRCLYVDGRMPHVMYRAKGQNVSLYILEGRTRPPADLVAFGHRSRIWSRGATTYVLVSSSDSAMEDAAQYVMREAH